MPTNHRKNLFILFFTLVIVMLGFGMVIPIFPFMLERMGGSGTAYGLLIGVYAIMQLIFAPVWGSLSDRVGRKPILLIGMLGNTLTLVLLGFSTQLWMLFAARILSGLLSSATLPTTMAYIGDSTSEQERGGGIGQLGAAAWLGAILGPGLGGLLAGDSLSLPFFLAAGLSFIALALIAWLLPESLPAEARQQAGGKVKMVDLGALWQALFSPIGLLLFMAFLISFGATNFQAIFSLYAMKKFSFDTQHIGQILVVAGLVSAAIQGALTGPLTRRWGETILIKVFLLTNALGFLILLLAYDFPTVLLTTGLYSLMHALLRPAIQSLTSKRAALSQGAAMGLNNSFLSLGQVAGPLWAGFVFDIHVDYPYLSGALILFIGFLISLVWMRPTRQETTRPEPQPTP